MIEDRFQEAIFLYQHGLQDKDRLVGGVPVNLEKKLKRFYVSFSVSFSAVLRHRPGKRCIFKHKQNGLRTSASAKKENRRS